MFPINFNFPYRKKDGSIITMEKALDGAGADLDLIDLDDVVIESPTGGQLFEYDGTAKKWKNSSDIPAAVTNMKSTMTQNGAHNLCPTNNITQVDKGITFTFNANKTVSASGSNATGSTAVCQLFADTYAAIGTDIEEGEQYIISGLTGGSLSTYCLELSFFNSSETDLGNAVVVTDSEKTFTVPSTTAYIRATLYVYTGVTNLNVTAYPMIRLVTDTDTTYTPYAKTNRELTRFDKLFSNAAGALSGSLSSNFTKYRYVMVYARTNNLVKSMIIPVEMIVSATSYQLDFWGADDSGQITNFSYINSIFIQFDSSISFTATTVYNNANFQPVITDIYGIC